MVHTQRIKRGYKKIILDKRTHDSKYDKGLNNVLYKHFRLIDKKTLNANQATTAFHKRDSQLVYSNTQSCSFSLWLKKKMQSKTILR